MDSTKKTSTLVGHLTELRKRLIIIFLVNIIGAFICFQYMDVLIQYIFNLNPGMKLIYLTPSELFMVYVKLAFTCAFVLCSPITIYQAWIFIAQGLYVKERKYVLFSLFFGFFFFIIGVVFGYNIALPTTLKFFMKYSSDLVTATISIDSFVSFCNAMLLSFGVVFEMPILVYLLSQIGILKPEFMKRSHGVLILIIFIIAAIITPPDVVSQVLLAIPMVILLELSIGICYMVDKKKKKEKLSNLKA